MLGAAAEQASGAQKRSRCESPANSAPFLLVGVFAGRKCSIHATFRLVKQFAKRYAQ